MATPLAVAAGLKPAQPSRQDTVATFIPLCAPHKPIVIAMTVDGNAPLAVAAGLKPSQPLRQDTVAIRIPLCGPHKTIVILRSAATKNLRPLHTNRAVDEKPSANYRP